MNWISTILSQYANFKGRSNRKDLLLYIIFIVLLVQAVIKFMPAAYLSDTFFVMQVVLFIPTVAIIVRRLHDMSKGSRFLLILFAPVVGIFWLGYILIQESKPYKNKYGATRDLNFNFKKVSVNTSLKTEKISFLRNAYMVLFNLIPSKN